MDWLDKLSDLVLGGLTSTLGGALPEHWRRGVRERLGDFNPYNVIAGNHDLLRAARLAWVRAAIDVLEAGKKSAAAMPAAACGEFNQSAMVRFETLAVKELKKIRSDALDRRTDPGHNPIDQHLQHIMQGTSEYVAPGEYRALDQSLTQQFNATLAALTGWPVYEIPAIFGQIARDGLPTMDRGAKRNFDELVFAVFAESLKNPNIYPEAAEAFNIAMQDAARKLSQTILDQIKGIDKKLDNLVDNADAQQVFLSGIDVYLKVLPELLQGQQRIEDHTSRILQIIETTARSSPNEPEEAITAQYQKLIEHLDREEFEQILTHTPRSLEAYRAHCIARWSQKRYIIDKQFTPLTLLLDQGENNPGERYQKIDREFHDLRDVLMAIDQTQDRVLVVTGAPGSGKSTLLRRLELDLASAALRSDNPDDPITLFLPLNAFGQRSDTIPEPETWIAQEWSRMTDGLPAFVALLGRPFVLLLDGLNEIPHGNRNDYDNRLGAWKVYLDKLVRDHPQVRVVFSCRTQDYGSKLTTKDLPRVPQVEVAPLSPSQVKHYLEIYSPEHATALWNQLDGSSQFDLYRSPYYLRLLIEQSSDGQIPAGRASLFTGYVRTMLKREMIDADNVRFKSDALVHLRDRERFGQWKTLHELPSRGLLFKTLASFAFNLQQQRGSEDKSQVRIDYDAALKVLSEVPDDLKDSLLKAAVDLQILDLPGDDVLFVHQLLQEYFAARHLAEAVNAAVDSGTLTTLCKLAAVKWLAADISPRVQEELQTLLKSETLKDLPTIGWEETFLLAAAMVNQPDAFLRMLADFNLPLAGRCAAQPDVALSEDLRTKLQHALVTRSRDPATDLRARIIAGHALGALGDPRFQHQQGPFGAFLLPPMVAIPGGVYAIGSDEGIDADEAPQHSIPLKPFQLGQFPVTNAEFRCFIDAGGYQDERWWDTPAAQRWHRGVGTGKARRKNLRYWRDRFKNESDLLDRVAEEQAWPKELLRTWQKHCAQTDEAFDEILVDLFPDQQFTLPEFWNDPAFNAPSQPIVGVCWFEARAYCLWLSAQTGQPFRLPSEVEWEAAARGQENRCYPWGNTIETTDCNHLETKIRRTTPVGVFPQSDAPVLFHRRQTECTTLSDMAGNVWEWTISRHVSYPYQPDDGREDAQSEDARVLRGGSWRYNPYSVRACARHYDHPDSRGNDIGFRVLCSSPIE
ncbi:SUMF1/EgtB/PvdO family nonheme iron enzyme [Nitrosomonas ureae]|uniref:NACHT domain-containing protein n=1 Tax=Nitrosomonas ureae TaxID=44577 RepID=A0A2T5IU82_9PROT|nr:SUMF1/EgtB/PvdO family nonheme iron enzyme [Nitrosomonas ureae]PTQ87435.1 NACHT domain-containing protein [Nitrosomonas ureae]